MGWRSAKSIDSSVGLGDEIQATNPDVVLYYVGDTSHQASKSDHNPCGCHEVVCAVDVMQNGGPDLNVLAEHIRQRVLNGDQRTSYLIWDRRIFSGQGQSYPAGQWRTYTGSNPHTDHIHLSVRHGPELYDDPGPWGWSGGGTAPPDPLEEVMGWYANQAEFEAMVTAKCNLAVRQVLGSKEGHDRIMQPDLEAIDRKTQAIAGATVDAIRDALAAGG
jgi:hypothetical protein